MDASGLTVGPRDEACGLEGEWFGSTSEHASEVGTRAISYPHGTAVIVGAVPKFPLQEGLPRERTAALPTAPPSLGGVQLLPEECSVWLPAAPLTVQMPVGSFYVSG